MTNTLLIITRDQEEFYKKILSLDLPALQVFAPDDDAELESLLPQANIILGNPPLLKKYISRASSLVWLQSTFAGVDALIDPELPSHYLLTNVKDAYGETMAEFAFAYILAFQREIFQNRELQSQALWRQKEYRVLSEKTIGILGAGSIGKEIARTAKFFGMKTIGLRTEDLPVKHFDRIYTNDHICEFLKECDVAVSVLPRTSKTRYMLTKEHFLEMKETALFMNLGRGDLFSDQDLIDALALGRPEKAVLDVFEKEPLPPEHPFWSTSNIFVTPHVSGYYNSEKIFEIFEDNYMRFRKGQELLYQVDFFKGY